MGKKSRKDSFFKRSVEVANNGFKGIFKDIVQNAKNNSDVDMKVLEPNLNEVIKEIAEELKKDKNGAKFKLEELKGVASNAMAAVKDAIKNDKKNNLDDSIKDEWVEELDDFDLESFIDNMDFDDLDDEEEESFESMNDNDDTNVENILSEEQVKRVMDAITLLLCSTKNDKFRAFIYRHNDDITSILSYKTCKSKGMPIEVEPNKESDIDLSITRSMELVYEHIGLEDGDIVNEEVEDGSEETNDYLDNLDNIEYEEIKEEKKLLTTDVLNEYKEIIEKANEYKERLKTFRDRMSIEEKNLVDYAISCLIEIYEMFKKSEEFLDFSNENDNVDFVDFILYHTNVIDNRLLMELVEGSKMIKIELLLVTIMNIPVL